VKNRQDARHKKKKEKSNKKVLSGKGKEGSKGISSRTIGRKDRHCEKKETTGQESENKGKTGTARPKQDNKKNALAALKSSRCICRHLTGLQTKEARGEEKNPSRGGGGGKDYASKGPTSSWFRKDDPKKASALADSPLESGQSKKKRKRGSNI